MALTIRRQKCRGFERGEQLSQREPLSSNTPGGVNSQKMGVERGGEECAAKADNERKKHAENKLNIRFRFFS